MNPIVVFETDLGVFEVEIYEDKAPLTAKNFLDYVNEGFYDGTIFHRVIDGFMIQGGGFTSDGGRKQTRAPIKNESGNGATNVNYSIAMARTSDLDSATAQFYLNVKDNGFLDDGEYCAFGMTIAGHSVIDKIKKVAVKKPGKLSEAQPVNALTINSAKVKASQ